ncbi:hypothetical protein PVAP13_5KG530700, partial [Panicum virgatum]
MDSSSSATGGRLHDGMLDLPLIDCPNCQCQKLKGLKARTKKNFGHFFFVCPTHQRDGSGCQFWCWEDEYQEYLITHGHVDASYQPIFASNMKLVQSQVIPEHEANE